MYSFENIDLDMKQLRQQLAEEKHQTNKAKDALWRYKLGCSVLFFLLMTSVLGA